MSHEGCVFVDLVCHAPLLWLMEIPGKGYRRIALIGMPASGKTSVGLALSVISRLPFVDLDKFIEKEAGMSVSDIFNKEGEQGFRLRETKALGSIASMASVILATGGGSVESSVNRAVLKRRFHCVWLKAEMETLLGRTETEYCNLARPLLAGDKRARLMLLAERRLSLYKDCSDLVADTESKSPEEIAGEIYDSIR